MDQFVTNWRHFTTRRRRFRGRFLLVQRPHIKTQTSTRYASRIDWHSDCGPDLTSLSTRDVLSAFRLSPGTPAKFTAGMLYPTVAPFASKANPAPRPFGYESEFLAAVRLRNS